MTRRIAQSIFFNEVTRIFDTRHASVYNVCMMHYAEGLIVIRTADEVNTPA